MEEFPWLRGRMPPTTVIPTCVDAARFVPAAQPPGAFVLGYVGSVGTWYLFDTVLAAFAALRTLRQDARLLVVNRNDHAYIRERIAASGIPPELVELRAAEHADVPLQMARMHAAVFFYKPSPSRVACAPTKLGEFLACGIPCLGNAGVGDMAEILEGERVGVAVQAFDDAALLAGLRRLLALLAEPDIRARCAAAAARHFSLEQGVGSYARVYAAIEHG